MASSMHRDGFTYEDGRVLTCDALSATGLVRHGFSVNREGTSTGIFTSLNLGMHTQDDPETVRHNFALFCRDLSVDPCHLVLAQQTHSTNIRSVVPADAGKGLYADSDFTETDGLMTDQPGLALATFYADCTPILLLDPVRHVIASVHSGWRGTLGKIAQRAVLAMRKQYGCRSEDILVAMGPSIKQCHFEVDEDVYFAFLDRFRGEAERCTKRKNEKYYIDTDRLNVHSLLETGVLQGHISVCPLCTYCEEELFFSHRRSGETGRMCAVIELK